MFFRNRERQATFQPREDLQVPDTFLQTNCTFLRSPLCRCRERLRRFQEAPDRRAKDFHFHRLSLRMNKP